MREIDKAIAAYQEHFDVPYVRAVTGGYVLDLPDGDAAAAKALRNAVATDTPVPDFEYEEGAAY